MVELNGGTSNASFMWTIIANRADDKDSGGAIISKFADTRFPLAPGAQSNNINQTITQSPDSRTNIPAKQVELSTQNPH